MPLPEDNFSASASEGKFSPTRPERSLIAKAIFGVSILVGLTATLGVLAFFAEMAFGIHDSPVEVGGGSIYGRVALLHIFHEDRANIHYHASRDFATNSQILMIGVVPPNTTEPITCQISITNSTSWNIQLSGRDGQLNEKPDVASVCSNQVNTGNQVCDIDQPPDSSGHIHIQANPSSSNVVGWDRQFGALKLDYFDNSTGCATQPGQKESPCNYLSYLTWQVNPSPPTPPPSQPIKYGCNGGTCTVKIGGPLLKTPAPACPM